MTFKHVHPSVAYEYLKTNPNGLKIATTGDIHLHHPRVSTERIIRHLDEMFNDEYLALVDILILNGDIFDRRLSLESDDFKPIMSWITSIMYRCAKHNVKLYVLEGTRSHDHKQNDLFEFLQSIGNIHVYLEYIDKVDIVEIHPGVHALFVPDEVNHDASITATQIHELMTLKGLEQVDFAFMHGMFRYQLPIESIAAHSEEFFNTIVKHKVVINHIHIPSLRGKISAPGSPVRLRHNEEETKGHHLMVLEDGGVTEFFIETLDNVVFDTLDVTQLDLPGVLDLIESKNYGMERCFIRLRMARDSTVRQSLNVIKSRWPQHQFSEDFIDSDITTLGQGDDLVDVDIVSVVLDKENITNILKDRMSAKFGSSESHMTVVNKVLSEE